MDDTPEFRAVSISSGVLVDGIAADIERYAEKFHDEELITDTEYNIALKTTVEVGDAHKARRIVQNIAAKVKARPSLFYELLRVLKEIGLTEQADKVETKFLNYGGKLSKKNTVEHGGDRTSLQQATHSSVREGGDRTDLPVIQSKDKGASGRKRSQTDRNSAGGDHSQIKQPRMATSGVQTDCQESADNDDSDDYEDDSPNSEDDDDCVDNSPGSKNDGSDNDNDGISMTPTAHVEQPYNNEAKFKDPKTKQDTFDYDEFCKHVEFVIAVFNDNEFNAATTVISSPEYDPDDLAESDSDKLDSLTNYQPCIYLGKIDKHPVGLLRCGQGRKSADTLNKIVNIFSNAKYLIGAGVCYGFKDDVRFGDVLISKNIIHWEKPKFTKIFDKEGDNTGMSDEFYDTFKENFNKKSKNNGMSDEICDIFRHLPSEKNMFQVASPERFAEYYETTIISHDILVDDKNLVKMLKYACPHAYGGEMEGGELLRIRNDTKIQVIIIKAVTDYGDGTKDKEWQYIGAQAAFHYVKCKMNKSSVSELEKGWKKAVRTVPTGRTVTDGSFSTTGSSNSHDQKIQEILQHVGIDMEKLNQCPDDNALRTIAKILGREWQTYALKLRISQDEIENIQDDFGRVLDRRHEALKLWRKKRSNATYKELVEVFIEEENLHLATEVCELLK